MAYKIQRHKFGIRSLIVFLVFGSVFGAAAVFGYQSYGIDDSWDIVSGTVVDVTSHRGKNGTLYAPVVAYEVSGRMYEVTSRSRSSVYPTLGNSREVAYNPDRPDQSKLVEGVGLKMVLLGFFLVGVSFILFGLILFIRSLKRSRVISYLLESGRKLSGVLIETRKTGSFGKKPLYRIVVAATDFSGVVQNYESDFLSNAGGLLLADLQNNPVPVSVFIDPENHDLYYVNVSDLSNLTPQRIKDLIGKLKT